MKSRNVNSSGSFDPISYVGKVPGKVSFDWFQICQGICFRVEVNE